MPANYGPHERPWRPQYAAVTDATLRAAAEAVSGNEPWQHPRNPVSLHAAASPLKAETRGRIPLGTQHDGRVQMLTSETRRSGWNPSGLHPWLGRNDSA